MNFLFIFIFDDSFLIDDFNVKASIFLIFSCCSLFSPCLESSGFVLGAPGAGVCGDLGAPCFGVDESY